MSYERKDIPALINVFAAAREVLLGKTTMHYLCHALEALLIKGFSPTNVVMAKKLVNEAIGYHVSLAGYYHYKNPYPRTAEGERNIRIQWCDQIIRDLREYAK